MEKYWRFIDVDREKGIVIINEAKGQHRWEMVSRRGITGKALVWTQNGFFGKTEAEIRDFLTKKMREIVREFCKDNRLDMREEWNKDNSMVCNYFHDGITIGDVYKVYKDFKEVER